MVRSLGRKTCSFYVVSTTLKSNSSVGKTLFAAHVAYALVGEELRRIKHRYSRYKWKILLSDPEFFDKLRVELYGFSRNAVYEAVLS